MKILCSFFFDVLWNTVKHFRLEIYWCLGKICKNDKSTSKLLPTCQISYGWIEWIQLQSKHECIPGRICTVCTRRVQWSCMPESYAYFTTNTLDKEAFIAPRRLSVQRGVSAARGCLTWGGLLLGGSELIGCLTPVWQCLLAAGIWPRV